MAPRSGWTPTTTRPSWSSRACAPGGGTYAGTARLRTRPSRGLCLHDPRPLGDPLPAHVRLPDPLSRRAFAGADVWALRAPDAVRLRSADRAADWGRLGGRKGGGHASACPASQQPLAERFASRGGRQRAGEHQVLQRARAEGSHSDRPANLDAPIRSSAESGARHAALPPSRQLLRRAARGHPPTHADPPVLKDQAKKNIPSSYSSDDQAVIQVAFDSATSARNLLRAGVERLGSQWVQST